jgi:hypothetical protein
MADGKRTRLFAVTRTRGPAWQDSLPLEDQDGWKAHASFMDDLQRDGFIVLGGPLEGTPDVLLVVRADTQAAILARLGEDPWTVEDRLRVTRVAPWTLRLGALP